jgi:predicted O-methyltransferase YrrM
MEFISEELLNYCQKHSTAEHPVLARLNRYTHANVMQPRMLSGHLQGSFLTMLTHMIKPEYVLEIGTYTGYSAICMAQGLPQNGKLITIDVNPELEHIITKFVADAGLQNKIKFIVGDAYQIIRTLNLKFDMVFIDADKYNYLNYYKLVIDKLNPGGYIIADNVLWSGKVLNPTDVLKDKDTKAIDEFNKFVANDNRVTCVLLPVRDGLMLIRKNE